MGHRSLERTHDVDQIAVGAGLKGQWNLAGAGAAGNLETERVYGVHIEGRAQGDGPARSVVRFRLRIEADDAKVAHLRLAALLQGDGDARQVLLVVKCPIDLRGR